VLVILLLSGLACTFVTDFFEEKPEGYIPEAEPSIEESHESNSQGDALLCPAVAERILEIATEFYEEDSDAVISEEPELTYLVTYTVTGDQISAPYFEDVSGDLAEFQDDALSHQEIWDYFVRLIPRSQRNSLAEYAIFTDGEGNELAAVTQTSYDPDLWGLEVDIRDSDDKLDLTYTLIHEYAHLLTLGPNQVTPSLAVFNYPDDDDIYYFEVSTCPDYFPGEGCSRADSYINAFYRRFWFDIHEEWLDINVIEDDDAYYEALDDFYYKYEDRFLTGYAATNPEEDIAEVFTFFVLSPRPKGDTVAEQKILFFYDYPELVQLRDEINAGICGLNP